MCSPLFSVCLCDLCDMCMLKAITHISCYFRLFVVTPRLGDGGRHGEGEGNRVKGFVKEMYTLSSEYIHMRICIY